MSQAVTDLADEPSSLLEWATRLAVDPHLRARLATDPRGLLGELGFAHVLPADLHHALPLVTDGVAARLGHDVDPARTGAVEAQRAGEHPLDALARQFTHVSDAVLAGPPSEDPEHDLDDHLTAGPHDPTAVLDDLTDPDDPVAHHLDPHHPDPHDLHDVHGLHAFGVAPVPVLVAVPDPAPDPAPDPVEAAPVVGNEDAPDPLHVVAEHPLPDHDPPDLHPDVHHDDPHPDVHPTHDVLDL